jgi:hypothetical protein
MQKWYKRKKTPSVGIISRAYCISCAPMNSKKEEEIPKRIVVVVYLSESSLLDSLPRCYMYEYSLSKYHKLKENSIKFKGICRN